MQFLIMLDAFCRRARRQTAIDKLALFQQRLDLVQLCAAEYSWNDNEHLASRAECVRDTAMILKLTIDDQTYDIDVPQDLLEEAQDFYVKMDQDMDITLVFVKSDGDNDGIPDDVDQCLNTPEGEEVDENGCSASQIDTDGDGQKRVKPDLMAPGAMIRSAVVMAKLSATPAARSSAGFDPT